MTNFNYKLEKELLPKINNIANVKILELGVQKGRSTLEFLKICKKIMVDFIQLILMTVLMYQKILIGNSLIQEMIISN